MEVDLTLGLPPNHRLVYYTSLSTLQSMAQAILSNLENISDTGTSSLSS